MSTKYIRSVADTTDRGAQVQQLGADDGGLVYRRDSDTVDVMDPDTGTWYSIPLSQLNSVGSLILAGVAAGYKLARGVHTQVAASDTVVTGLATVVACLVSPKTRTVKQLFFNGDIGTQAGAPAAGSILITSQKPTAVNDVTPTAATDFTENIDVHWVAIGT